MIEVSIYIREEYGISREEIVFVCVPFEQGAFYSDQQFSLTNNTKQILHQTTVLNTWGDNSLKWVRFDFLINVEANQLLKLQIKPIEKSSTLNLNSPYKIVNFNDSIEISNGTIRLIVNTEQHTILIENRNSNSKHALKLVLKDGVGENCSTIITDVQCKEKSTEYLKKEILVSGIFSQEKINDANFKLIFTLFSNSENVKIDFTLHNPQAAKHNGGLWDLGDEHSLFFQSLVLDVSIEKNAITKIIDSNTARQYLFNDEVNIEQFSSGGKNWQSPVHKNFNGDVLIKKNGFVIGDHAIEHSGARISPIVSVNDVNKSISAYIENFWQNFPKAIIKTDSTLKLEFFPLSKYELQGGEQKTHTVWLKIGTKNCSFSHITNPLSVEISPIYIKSTGALEYFSEFSHEDILINIIQKGIIGNDTFFDKRESVDEYGWRNFGDLYADHETERYQGSDIFVSHYNNQYDPLYGFIYQYMLTGEKQWFELANDLAKHVKDIDIYHTDKDKDEYNGGLFWHTDHYLDASTCTHRTFSKNHQAAYEGYTSGGGPGGQHCYTTGMKLHYCLTGDESSKEAVLQLTHWITHSFEGSPSFIAKLYAIKQSGRHGAKNHITGQYPLDRGTGHYVIALLDSFDLTNEKKYLDKAFEIIEHTIHPVDNIASRNFENIESTWFYTVFLQAVGRFLLTKEQLKQLDDKFYYARDALLHYVDWMCVNEQPYLEQKNKLEFPNATWTAQDLRKVGLFYIADYYSPKNNGNYIDKAEFFYQYISNNLINEKSSNFTRIRVLLMQNYGCVHFYRNKENRPLFHEVSNYSIREIPNKMFQITKLLFKELTRLSIKRELKWLSLRSTTIANLLGK